MENITIDYIDPISRKLYEVLNRYKEELDKPHTDNEKYILKLNTKRQLRHIREYENNIIIKWLIG